MSINCNYYHDIKDYYKTTCSNCSTTIDIGFCSIVHSAIVYGGQKNVPLHISLWKISNILLFSKVQYGKPSEFRDFKYLEGSEKTTIAFLIGSTYAHLHVANKYGVKHLYHLTDLNKKGYIITKNPNNELRPDFWGVGKDSISYLVEAKGTTYPLPSKLKKSLKKGVQQVKSVLSVQDTNSTQQNTYNDIKCNLERIVIGTQPDSQNRMVQQIIFLKNPNCFYKCDTMSNLDLGKNLEYLSDEDYQLSNIREEIVLDSSKLMYFYYENLIRFMLEREVNTHMVMSRRCSLVEMPEINCRIGLLEDVFDVLKESYRENKNKERLFREVDSLKINGILDELFMKTENKDILSTDEIYIGSDGIVVMKIESEEKNRGE